jgi:hypothetical protein
MGEAIWCNVKVRVPERWVPVCLEAMDGVLISGDTDTEPPLEDSDHVELHWNGEGNYGLYDDGIETFLNWCIEWHVPFYASSDPKYEYEGEIRMFDGTTLRQGEAFSEQAALTIAQYKAIVAGMSEFASVDEFFTLLNTYDPPAPTVVLGDFPPPNADDIVHTTRRTA